MDLVAVCLVIGICRSPARSQVSEQIVYIEDGAPMKYFKGESEPPADWNTIGFDDGAWLDGKLPIGYGEPEMVPPNWTVISDMQGSYLSVYMRIPFDVADPALIQQLRVLQVRYDDGFIMYLNGVEILRASMPAGAATHTTAATSHEWVDGARASRVVPDAGLQALIPGRNILAVQGHNTNLTSSDFGFQIPTFLAIVEPPPDPEFIRGSQCDGNDSLDIADPVYLLRWQFGSFYPEPGCVKSCDMNDDGLVDVSDAIMGLEYLFLARDPFPAPYPDTGTDPTADDLTCATGAPQEP